jgi:hypothetical protein
MTRFYDKDKVSNACAFSLKTRLLLDPRGLDKVWINFDREQIKDL